MKALLLLLLLASSSAGAVEWQKWDERALFERARRENRFVLIDLQAVWCHWCHVMEETTYRDARVNELLRARYLAVQADQDATPELSSRYEDYGWPATIVLAPDGSEIVKRRGYIDPERMASLLEAIIADPTPGPSVTAEREGVAAALDARSRAAAREKFFADYDAQWGGWGDVHKFVQADALDLAAALARTGDARARRMWTQTLDAALQLVDPVWGGVYQYSDAIDWRSPHFEKIVSIQADAMRVYADAYRELGDVRYLRAARAVEKYVDDFLAAPEGGIYASQDADLSVKLDGHEYFRLSDEKRRALGIPRVDKHRYARECGWMIGAWAALARATGDEAVIKKAARAADWALRERALSGGGFQHEIGHGSLADNVAMADGLAALARADGANAARWNEAARATFAHISRRFRDARGGFFSVPPAPSARGVFARPRRSVDENVALGRAAARFAHATGDPTAREVARHALRYLGGEIARPSPAGILMADLENATMER
jgi:uncharacterized protein